MTPAAIIESLKRQYPEKYALVGADGRKQSDGVNAAGPIECPHLGGPTGESVGCRSCSGLVDMDVYRCRRHGLTVIGDRAPASDTIRACRWCDDRPRPKPTIALTVLPRASARVALPPFPVPVAWVSTARLALDSAALAGLVPADCSGIVGVPRSGMLPASMIATQLHLPLGEVDRGGKVRWLASGSRGGSGLLSQRGPVVVVDDTVYGGSAMKRVRTQLAREKAIFACVYARPEAAGVVDIYARPLAAPHLLEWNFANNGPMAGFASDSSFGNGIATDLDGILCHDEFSGGVVGTPFLTPRLHPVRLIVTGRNERHRAATENDLRRWRVRWEKLVMLPNGVACNTQNAAEHKARHYAAAGQGYFMESCPEQSAIIHELTGKRVICPRADKVFTK